MMKSLSFVLFTTFLKSIAFVTANASNERRNKEKNKDNFDCAKKLNFNTFQIRSFSMSLV